MGQQIQGSLELTFSVQVMPGHTENPDCLLDGTAKEFFLLDQNLAPIMDWEETQFTVTWPPIPETDALTMVAYE